MPKLDGKNVLITGASSGIGQAIAIRFAQEGANVAINYRSGAEQAQVTRKTVMESYVAMGKPERKTIVVQADVAYEEQVKAMFQKVLEAFGTQAVGQWPFAVGGAGIGRRNVAYSPFRNHQKRGRAIKKRAA